MSFSPAEILYIVLSFCVFWISAALFWFIWQAAQILKNVNGAVDEARDKIGKIESAITGIKNRFDAMTTPVGLLVDGLKKVVEYAIEKRASRRKDFEE
ncbi:hypothetical protein A2348_05640 [Candidatus Uhrbacteria bacterium RIFOXYB12_FULL_58_10]|uniref:DUF948 domain-containing protein n=1 Tax=Candidatus Uhrbacteria bacterium RIFOXYB2_FULL_57_15 TaxID=1802422 RepID=A0A1F7W8Z5_9BACT|nr:MAG: hypothetical protein A2348_05640 [Candidatus Uhrbacteria bacterium RIFOXYB12_FULL_58_10]OGL98858.1 MAG: hypothetical protein A2304_03860 [Candidatus Uhrbacteria bacterium RIFOXYB2_FULL_57_15]